MVLVELAGRRDKLVEVRQPILAVARRLVRRGARGNRSGPGACADHFLAHVCSRAADSSSISRAKSSKAFGRPCPSGPATVQASRAMARSGMPCSRAAAARCSIDVFPSPGAER